MNSRHTADYVLQDDVEKEDAAEVIAKAKAFVEEVKEWLLKRDLL